MIRSEISSWCTRQNPTVSPCQAQHAGCRHRHRLVPLEWQSYLPRVWTDEPDRCRRAGVPQEVVHRTNWRLALGLLDTLAQWQLEAPVVVAEAGYGVSTPFRLGLQERGRCPGRAS
ncbi:transposase [Streptomyces griseorubiginosus]|uniref:transposase n=1 Tax=Streptomyces griseorubiginosus TaxID=67304 RepID=UPI00200E2845|nr:transposase [Streptomyces griseorubiginosus]